MAKQSVMKASAKAGAADDPDLAVLGAGALAIRSYQREVERMTAKAGAVSDSDQSQLASYPAFTILLFMAEYENAGMTQKKHLNLLRKFNVDTAGNVKTFPLLSQSALFEIFGNLGLSRESIRRLLILLAEHGLLDRTSKGPPFPDQLGISRAGGRLMKRAAKRLRKEVEKSRQFGYL